MGFGNLGDYLSKFKGLVPPDNFIKEAVVRVIAKEFGIEIPKKNITASRGVIYLSVQGALKSEIYQRKGKILKLIENEGVVSIRDIR